MRNPNRGNSLNSSIEKTTMEQLLQKDGAMNVNWEGSFANIARDKLSTIAAAENG